MIVTIRTVQTNVTDIQGGQLWKACIPGVVEIEEMGSSEAEVLGKVILAYGHLLKIQVIRESVSDDT